MASKRGRVTSSRCLSDVVTYIVKKQKYHYLNRVMIMNLVRQEAIHSRDVHGIESNRKPVFKVKISDMMMAGRK